MSCNVENSCLRNADLFNTNYVGFPGTTAVKSLPASAGDVRDPGLIPGPGRPPGGGSGNPLQYPCLENAMDRGAWRATVQGISESRTRLSG